MSCAPSLSLLLYAIGNLDNFEALYGYHWNELMVMKTKQPAVDNEVGDKVRDLQAQLELEVNSDGNYGNCNDGGNEDGV